MDPENLNQMDLDKHPEEVCNMALMPFSCFTSRFGEISYCSYSRSNNLRQIFEGFFAK